MYSIISEFFFCQIISEFILNRGSKLTKLHLTFKLIFSFFLTQRFTKKYYYKIKLKTRHQLYKSKELEEELDH